MSHDEGAGSHDRRADRDQPWWASEDPAGHRSGGGSSHGDHSRPAWLDAVEALDGAVRAAAGGARAATGTAPRPGDGEEREAGPEGPSSRGDGAPHEGAPFGSAEGPDAHRHGVADAWCHVCPVCSLLRALEDVRPDVLVHLGEAARHLSMAAKAVVDAQAGRAQAAAPDDFETIPVDD